MSEKKTQNIVVGAESMLATTTGTSGIGHGVEKEQQMTNKQKLNAEIARYFGFTESDEAGFKINGLSQWSYPGNWYLSQGSIPNTCVPDFVEMLEDYLKLVKKNELGGPREWFGAFDK